MAPPPVFPKIPLFEQIEDQFFSIAEERLLLFQKGQSQRVEYYAGHAVHRLRRLVEICDLEYSVYVVPGAVGILIPKDLAAPHGPDELAVFSNHSDFGEKGPHDGVGYIKSILRPAHSVENTDGGFCI